MSDKCKHYYKYDQAFGVPVCKICGKSKSFVEHELLYEIYELTAKVELFKSELKELRLDFNKPPTERNYCVGCTLPLDIEIAENFIDEQEKELDELREEMDVYKSNAKVATALLHEQMDRNEKLLKALTEYIDPGCTAGLVMVKMPIVDYHKKSDKG